MPGLVHNYPRIHIASIDLLPCLLPMPAFRFGSLTLFFIPLPVINPELSMLKSCIYNYIYIWYRLYQGSREDPHHLARGTKMVGSLLVPSISTISLAKLDANQNRSYNRSVWPNLTGEMFDLAQTV